MVTNISFILSSLLNDKKNLKSKFVNGIFILDHQYEIVYEFYPKPNLNKIELIKERIPDIIEKLNNDNDLISLPFQNKNDLYIYKSFIKIDNEKKYYLLGLNGRKDDWSYIQSMGLLSQLISHRLITFQKSEKLFLQSELQRKIIDDLPEGHMTINAEGTILYMNKAGAKIFGVERDGIIGENANQVFRRGPSLLAAIRENRSWINKEVFVTVQNTKYHLLETAVPLINENVPIGLMIVFHPFQNARNIINDIQGPRASFTFDEIIHESIEMKNLIETAKVTAINDATVLIEGESGTGKELIAQSIHNANHRRKGPFITIDCSSMPKGLVESELFGYVEGAFTGAKKEGKMGKFELANGGTIFLDEIGEMPIETQSHLLRVLQTRTVTRIGSEKPIPIDIRVISATNRNLEDEIKKKNFRLDLYFRLNVIQLTVPSLKERKGDVPLLADHFLKKSANREGIEQPRITKEALKILENYKWPGNVRELENMIERIMIFAEDVIHVEHLPDKLIIGKSKNRKIYQTLNLDKGKIEEVEQQLILKVLQESNGNKSLTAKKLGMARSTLYEKLNALQEG